MGKEKRSAAERELARLRIEEDRYIGERLEKKDSALNRLLADKVPQKLRATLDKTFAAAFRLVFEKGGGLIELGCGREAREKQYKIDRYAAQIRGDRKSLRAFSRKAGGAGNVNLALSGAAGIGMGALGVGLPDIAVFTGLMLKNIYEIALSYGYGYDSPEERAFILRVIFGAVSYGDELRLADRELNALIDGEGGGETDMDALIARAAGGLSKELLYMKFLQGIPVVGAVGGFCDAVYMKRLTRYAQLKYRRRLYRELEREARPSAGSGE